MNAKKNALISRNNDQRNHFKLMICFTITFFTFGGLSFYGIAYGQNPNSSDLDASSTNILNNSNTPLKINNATSDLDEGHDFSSALPDLFNHVKQSVVQITDPEDLQQQSEITGSRLGSGFVYDNEGHIITNYHVVAGAKNNTVYVTFLDGVSYEANVTNFDPYADLAVIKLINLDKNKDVLSKLVPLELGNSTSLRIGEKVAAVGNPFGLSGSLTDGIVSGLGRLIPAGSEQFNPPPTDPFDNPDNTPITATPSFSIPNIIQTDAAINPGNSGGPLLNMKGQVIGINSAIFSNTGAYSGVGFAIPSNLLNKIIPTLLEGKTYEHPYMGINGFDVTPEIAKLMNLSQASGFLVVNVTENSPASLAGVVESNTTIQINGNPMKIGGDVIIKIDNSSVRKVDDILSYLETSKEVGDNVSLTVLREGNQSKVLNLELTARPQINASLTSPPLAIGVVGLDVTPEIAKLINLTTPSGFLITGVLDQSPASKADLRGGYIIAEINGTQIELGGDVVIKIDNSTVRNVQDIKKHISTKSIGDTIVVSIIRDGTTMTKNLTLTDFSDGQFELDNDREGLLEQNPPFNFPPIPNEQFKDFLDSCSRILGEDTCNSIIPNR
ncbi:MAG: trypsin-like peptidase domain-containing protein [Nitrosopumilus sp.]|nr:trypsin-like peptidase domain-containing protein [Nitrosopumilus sp.]